MLINSYYANTDDTFFFFLFESGDGGGTALALLRKLQMIPTWILKLKNKYGRIILGLMREYNNNTCIW